MWTRRSGPGRFGMAEETATLLNTAIADGVAKGLGIGQAVGAFLLERNPPFAHFSVAATAARLGIPLTAHVAIGTDIIHMHPIASGRGAGRRQPARLSLLHVGSLASSRAACTSTAVRP